MNWQEHITINPNVCKGRACVAGTRILVSGVLDNLAAGVAPVELIRSYPPLTADDIQACLAYAAALAQEQVLPLGEPTPA
jgi:uncharacterized protein (DUF433 family)